MTKNYLKPVAAVLWAMLISLFVVSTAQAAKGGNGGGKPGGGEPPACEGEYPGFSFARSGGRKSADAIYLASSDGCQETLVSEMPEGRGNVMHWDKDSNKGTFVLVTDPGNQGHYVIQRVEFSLDHNGTPDVSVPSRLDLFPDDASLPSEDYLYHFYMGYRL